MKLKFLVLETKAPPWLVNAREEYLAKLGAFHPFDLQIVKSPSFERENAAGKMKKEAELLMRHIDSKDLLILFYEAGKTFTSSEDFAKHFGRYLESGKALMIFCIGGPYGFSEDLKARAQARWSLSGLTMNHWVAQLTALEQLYRALTILKGIPYHNR
jgi:23S rRNA (pseudouridine1915-N3)-methyltransferase